MELRDAAPLELHEEPLPAEEGGPSAVCSLLRWTSSEGEAVHLLRRAGPFSSKLLCAESRCVERQYRFHKELAPLLACGEQAGHLRPAVAPQDPDPMNDLYRELSHDHAKEGVFEVVHTRVVVRDLPKPERNMPLGMLHLGDKVRGVVKEFSGQPWVELSNSCKAQFGMNREKPAYVQMSGERLGLGELLRRTNEAPPPEPDGWRGPVMTAKRLPLPPVAVVARHRASVVLAAESVAKAKAKKKNMTYSRAELFAKAKAKKAEFEAGLAQSSSSEESSSDEEADQLGQEGFLVAHRKWTAVYEKLLDRAATREGRWLVIVKHMLEGRQVRIPWCLATYWGGDGNESWRSFLLSQERLGAPEWHVADDRGCNDSQARAATECLGVMHNKFRGRRILEAHAWLPMTPLNLEFPQLITHQFTACFKGLLNSGDLKGSLSPVVLEACELMCSIQAYGPKGLGRLMRPPLTLLHGDYHSNLGPHVQAWTGLRFSPVDPPAVAAVDWQWVCRGRGAFDLATFMALSLDVEDRREQEGGMLMIYGEAAGGRGGVAARAEFDDDLRAGFLATLVFFLLRSSSTLSSGREDAAQQATLKGLRRLDAAIVDWGAVEILGESKLARQLVEAEEQRKKDERIAARKARPKKKFEKQRVSQVDRFRRNAGKSTSPGRSKSPTTKKR
eukprot:TRINITY_DN42776_c0_g1_i1.p1 TRINITY_DN42776_c0_g1~~TRINITY_DN42776_c0_g1_i1.p1  ORF type:complete len:701 (+),score=121.97 TRINITY_DN42776_c0_g1_i1:85-2103(+)